MAVISLLSRATIASGVAAGGAASYLSTGDFNGDGHRDLSVVNTSTDKVSVVFGVGNGSFGTVTSYTTNVQPNSVGIGDFNRDNKPDLAIPTFFGTGGFSALTILQNGANGNLTTKGVYATDSRPIGNAIVDFTGDGILDIALANNFADSLFVFPGNGNGTFGTPLKYVVGDRPTWVASADFNGDGKPDLAVVNSNSGTVTILVTPTPATGTRESSSMALARRRGFRSEAPQRTTRMAASTMRPRVRLSARPRTAGPSRMTRW